MVVGNSAPGYGTVAKALHWLLFALIAAQFYVGLYMPHIRPSTPQEGLVAWHASLGTAILFFMALRLLWRVMRPVPMLTDIAPWERRSATAAHWLLYILVLVSTALGWAAAGYNGWVLKLFGVIPVPALAAKGAEWGHTSGDIHSTLVYVLLGVIGLHALAALYHYFYKHDRVLQRMLPGG